MADVFEPSSYFQVSAMPKLDMTQRHFLYSGSQNSWRNAVYANNVAAYDDFSYIRENNVVRVPANAEWLKSKGVNYCSYENKNFGNKIFYCFVTKIEYKNPNVSWLYLQTDIFQTWFYDCDITSAFVEREHAPTDTPGDNLVAEPIDPGTMVAVGEEYDLYNSGTQAVLVTTLDLANFCQRWMTTTALNMTTSQLSQALTALDSPDTGGSLLNDTYMSIVNAWDGITQAVGGGQTTQESNISTGTMTASQTTRKVLGKYTGYRYYIVDEIDANIDTIRRLFAQITRMGLIGNIADFYMAPIPSDISYRLINVYPGGSTYTIKEITRETAPTAIRKVGAGRPNSFHGYTPKNQKLKTYPYIRMVCRETAGNSAFYAYELFDKPSSPSFTLMMDILDNPAIMVSPGYHQKNVEEEEQNQAYKRRIPNYEESITCSNFPRIGWNVDTYANWAAQNSANYLANMSLNVQQMEQARNMNVITATSNIVSAGFKGASSGLTIGSKILGGAAGALGQTVQEAANLVTTQMANNYNIENTRTADENQQKINSVYMTPTVNMSSSPMAMTYDIYKITTYCECMQTDLLKRADDFLTVWGYATNAYKIPNLTSRRGFNYIKCSTIIINGQGKVPTDALTELQTLFQNGMTLWHDYDNFGFYGTNNDIV